MATNSKRPPLPLTALRSFEAVARTLSIEIAAEELNVTTSAVLHQLRQLEEVSGRKLLVRDRDVVLLTDAGRVLFVSTNKGLKILRQAMMEVQIFDGSETLNILIHKDANHQFIRDRINTYITRNVDVPVNVAMQSVVDDQLIESFDFVFSINPVRTDLFGFRQIHKEELRPYCNPDYLGYIQREPRESVSVRVLIVEDQDEERDLLVSAMRDAGFGKCNTISFPTRRDAGRAAIEGIGLAMIDRNIYQEEIIDGLLIPVGVTNLSIRKDFYIGSKKRSEAEQISRGLARLF